MRSRQKISAVVLVLLLGAVVYGLIRTTEPPAASSSQDNGKHGVPSRVPLVDQSPLKTAQRLAQLATTPEERPLAEEALRLADREVDLAFAAALRDAAENPPVLSPEAKEIEARLQKAQKLLKADQALVAQLTDAEAKATGDKKETLGDQLDLAKAELELDQDEVDDAKQDLSRAGGDPEDRIQEMVQEHEAAAHGNASAIPNTPPPPEERGLINRFQRWSALHQKQLQLWRAKQDSEAAASALTAQHNALESRVDAAKQESPELAHRSKRAKPAESPSPQPVPLMRAPEDSAALVQITKQIASDQKALATFDKRIDTHKQLADVYRKWIEVIAARQRTVINHALRGILVILAIALIALYFGTMMDKLVNRLPMDRRQIKTLHTVLLETGNWTDSGHPTGRRVTFTNSFAIEGHYFNFSTSGQWLWDELQVILPAGQDPYPMIEEIRNKVLDATKESAKQAEDEWRRASRSREMSSFSVAPALSVKPVVGGIEVAVRYITRANERYQLRAKLYQAIVEMLGRKNVTVPPSA